MLRLSARTRRLAAIALEGLTASAGGQQTTDLIEAGDEFTLRRRHRAIIERPVEPADSVRRTLYVVDIETIGFDANRDEITEIAVVRIETQDGTTYDQWEILSELVRPRRTIPWAARERSGITDEMVARAKTVDQVLPRAAALIGGAPIVAHNAHFDRRFLERNARLLGLSFARNEWICAMRMAQRVPTGPPYKLEPLAERLGIPGWRSHRAAGRLPGGRDGDPLVRQLLGGDISLPPLVTPYEDEPPPAPDVEYDADLSDRVFVFSGFRDELLATRIRNAGGEVASGVSERTTTLLVADTNAPPTIEVWKAAAIQGIEMQSRESFEQEFYISAG